MDSLQIWPMRNRDASRFTYSSEEVKLPLIESWKIELTGAVLAPPIYLDDAVYISSLGALHKIDSSQGKSVWQYKHKEVPYPKVNAFKASPAFFDNLVVVSDMTGIIYAVDPSSGRLIWENDQIHARDESFCVFDGYLFTRACIFEGSRKYGYACVDKDGKIIWFFESEGPYRTTSCAIKAGLLTFGDSLGNVYGINVESGLEDWRINISTIIANEGILSYKKNEISSVGMPIIVGNTLILRVGDYRNIVGIDIGTGRVKWHHIADKDRQLNGNALCLAVDNEHLYYILRDRFFRILVENGEIDMTCDNSHYELGDSSSLEGIVVGNYYFAGFNMSKRLVAINILSGEVEWVHEGDAGLSAPAIWVNGKLFIGSDLGYLSCYICF